MNSERVSPGPYLTIDGDPEWPAIYAKGEGGWDFRVVSRVVRRSTSTANSIPKRDPDFRNMPLTSSLLLLIHRRSVLYMLGSIGIL